MVLEIWFKKNGSSNLDFFSGSRKVVDQKKRWVYTINPHFFQVGEKWFSKLRFFFWFKKSDWPEKILNSPHENLINGIELGLNIHGNSAKPRNGHLCTKISLHGTIMHTTVACLPSWVRKSTPKFTDANTNLQPKVRKWINQSIRSTVGKQAWFQIQIHYQTMVECLYFYVFWIPIL